jgi:hypothetical protein
MSRAHYSTLLYSFPTLNPMELLAPIDLMLLKILLESSVRQVNHFDPFIRDFNFENTGLGCAIYSSL